MRRILIVSFPAFAAGCAGRPANVPPPPTIQESAAAQNEPEVRIIQKSGQNRRIPDERQALRHQGHPKIGLPYYLVDEDGSGKMNRIDTHDKLVVPRWVLMTFKRHRDTLKTVIPAQAGIQVLIVLNQSAHPLSVPLTKPWRCCVTLPYCFYCLRSHA